MARFPAELLRETRRRKPLRLRIEHAALTSLMVPTPDAALCAEIVSILRPHDAMEEATDGVYAECESLLTEAESAALLVTARGYPAVPTSRHFDGPTAHRTAASALASAARISRPRAEPPARRGRD